MACMICGKDKGSLSWQILNAVNFPKKGKKEHKQNKSDDSIFYGKRIRFLNFSHMLF
jgi:hypothetical protein